MGQISPKFRQATGYCLVHYCPGCEQLHLVFYDQGWTFNGDVESPTFTPSFNHGWSARPTRRCCHYVLTAGVLHYQPDCTHPLAGKSVPLPDLPADFTDFEDPVSIPFTRKPGGDRRGL
jgi:hypothetical protein